MTDGGTDKLCLSVVQKGGIVLSDPADKSLEICTFREVEGCRVVRALSESPQDLSVPARIEGGIGHDLLEEVRRDESRT